MRTQTVVYVRVNGQLVGLSKFDHCSQRGELIGKEPCQTCPMPTRAPIFQCAKYGRCSLFSKPLESARSCLTCEDNDSLKTLVKP